MNAPVPFVCPRCGTTFVCIGWLRKHLRMCGKNTKPKEEIPREDPKDWEDAT